jgi:starch-binding outer membrane protein, SusD/RagB family
MKLNDKISKFLLSVTLVFGLGLSSCELLIDPRQSIEGADALNSPDNMEAAISSPYARLRSVSSYGRNMVAFGDALADNGTATNNSGRLINEARNQPYSHYTHWTNSYFAINELNLIIEAAPTIQGVPAVTEATRNRWIGEAKFLRALYYFDLVRAYAYEPGIAVPSLDKGGIPLVLEGVKTTDFEKAINRQEGRSTVSQVYDQIYSDLEDAISKLNDSRGVQYASQTAARALLSRVALYKRDYAKVISEATLAFNSSRGRFLSGDDYVSGWRVSVHPESIFDLRFENASESIGVNESIQSTYTTIRNFENPTALGGWGDFIPSAGLRAVMGITVSGVNVTRGADVRARLYDIGAAGRGAGRQLECIKFASKSGFAFGDNIPIIRKSEVLLNRMEAYYSSGQANLALNDLNTLKKARGLAEVNLSGPALFEEIILERRRELAFEGHRFFDLKRLGRNIVKAQGEVLYTDFRILANIPQSEVDGNTNLEQNSGY